MNSWTNLTSCPHCNGALIPMSWGGCGGRGYKKGCAKCDKVYEQVTGGFVPTPGGEKWVEKSESLKKNKPKK